MTIIYTLAACLFALEATLFFWGQLFTGFRGIRRNALGGTTGGVTTTLLALGATTRLARFDVYPFFLEPTG